MHRKKSWRAERLVQEQHSPQNGFLLSSSKLSEVICNPDPTSDSEQLLHTWLLNWAKRLWDDHYSNPIKSREGQDPLPSVETR